MCPSQADDVPNQKNEEEGEDSYYKGGFHPVRLGDVYNGKYKVFRKLGYGRYSTVWLVRNQDDQRFWAMKVLSAECYGAGTDVFELEILRYFQKSNIEHVGYQYISALEDSFQHTGPNGCHVCLVFKVMGESFSTFRSWFAGRQVPSPLIQRFTTQLLHALDYAHSCGVIHTDIQPSNIMVQIPDDSLIASYLENTEVDSTATQQTADPTAISPTQGLRDFYFAKVERFNMMTLDIALADWGVASWSDNHLTEIIQPVLLRALEVMLKAPWGLSADIGNLGALVPELIFAQCMFNGRTKAGEYDARSHLGEMASLLGPFPNALLSKADPTIMQEVFDDGGELRDPQLGATVGLEVRFKSLGVEEAPKFVALIRSMLILDPEKRKSARELLDEPWMKHEYVDDILVEA